MSLIDESHISPRLQWGWVLYDFANSVLAINVGIYLTKWYVLDSQGSAAVLNSTIALATLASIFLIPRLFQFLRREEDILRSLDFVTWLILANGALVASLMLFGSKDVQIIAAPALLFTALVFYQISLLVYNLILPRHFPRSAQQKISGQGIAANWAGAFVGVTISAPFATEYSEAYSIALIFFGLNAVLALILMRKGLATASRFKLVAELQSLSLLDVSKLSGTIKPHFLFMLLFGFFLATDAVFAVQLNLPTYLKDVHLIGDSAQPPLFASILLSALVGGIASSWIKSTKWTWYAPLALAAAIALIMSGYALLFACAIAGFAIGVLEANTRSIVTLSSDKDQVERNLAIFGVFQRAGTIIGPIVWAGSLFTLGANTVGHTVALGLLSLLCVVASRIYFQSSKLIN